jgi:hypothetical protein
MTYNAMTVLWVPIPYRLIRDLGMGQLAPYCRVFSKDHIPMAADYPENGQNALF